MDVLTIVVAFAVLLVLTLKKFPVAIAALTAAVSLAAMNKMQVLDTLEQAYLGGMADFISSVWMVMLLGSVLSRLMDCSGAAASIAKFMMERLGVKMAVPAVILAGGLLVYGGLSTFAACYALYPIALVIFRRADIPRCLIPGVMGAGVYTWVNMLPGCPSVTNLIPITYLHTTAMAAPVIGIAAGGLTLLLSFLYFEWEIVKARKQGEGFAADKNMEKILHHVDEMEAEKRIPGFGRALAPMLCVAIALNVLRTDASAAMAAGILMCFVLFRKNIMGDLKKTLGKASLEASDTMICVASIVGVGATMKITPGFEKIVEMILKFTETGGNPLAVFATATALMSGLNASAMGGLSAVLSIMGDAFLNMGLNPDILHRVGVIAASGLGSLPHSGGIIALFTISGVSWKEGYRSLFVATILITTIALLAAVTLGNIL